MSQTTNSIAQRVAHDFVANFWYQLPGDCLVDRNSTVEGLRIWLLEVIESVQPGLNSYELVNFLRNRTQEYYFQVLWHPVDRSADRIAYLEALTHGLLMTMRADDHAFSIHQVWYDIVGTGINRALHCPERIESTER